MPSTVGLMMLAEPIISVLYQHGKFDAYQAAQAAGALRFYAIGLAGYAALKVLVNAFYALDRRKTPMLVSFLAVGSICCSTGFSPSAWAGDIAASRSRPAASPPSISCCCTLLMQTQLKGLESRRLLAVARQDCGGERRADRRVRRLVSLAAGRLAEPGAAAQDSRRCWPR